jgi:CubicO group peptidase (beta-lactamase class C family)
MMANGGELNGVRLVQPETMALMHTNHLPDEVTNAHQFGIGPFAIQPGLGYGYDVAVFDDPAKVGSPVGKGTFFWNGLAATFFWVDPTNDLIFVGMPQQWLLGGAPNVEGQARKLVYQALTDPAK